MINLLPILIDVNSDITDVKATIVAMIEVGNPVFFDCDDGQFSDKSA